MRKLFLFLFFTILFFNFSALEVSASFGVSPADLTIEHLRPGMTIKKEFMLSRTDLDKEVRVVVEPDIEGAKSWVDIEPGVSFTIPEGQRTKNMSVKIAVPEDAPLREYEGYLLVKVMDDANSSGVSVVQGVGIAVNLITTRLDVSRLLVRRVEIPDISQGKSIRILINTENQGNKSAAPEKVEIIVYDLSGKEIFRKEDNELTEVGVGETQEIVAEFSHDLEPGEYQADIKIYFQGEPIREDRLVFKVNKEAVESITPEPGQEQTGIGAFIRYFVIAFLVLSSLVIVYLKLLRGFIIKKLQ